MKLIIQIPCYNEEEALPVTLSKLPRHIEGVEKVEWLIIDDGSSDRTIEVASNLGVDHVVSFPRNQGLAKAFMAGLEECIRAGADIIVNIDADNQYCADDIPKLLEPIMNGTAEIAIGVRPIAEIEHFSTMKKHLQRLGSWIVRFVSKTDISDAPSGFRALTRDAAMRLNVFNEYTYTLETIIQAGQKAMAICSVPIRVNQDLRPSRLVKSTLNYVYRSMVTVTRIFVVYKPFNFFMLIGTIIFSVGLLIGLRFLYLFFITGDRLGHIQSLILASLFLGIGFQTILVAFLSDLLSVNRKLIEEVQYRLRTKIADK